MCADEVNDEDEGQVSYTLAVLVAISLSLVEVSLCLQRLLEIKDTHRPGGPQWAYAWDHRTTLGALLKFE